MTMLETANQILADRIKIVNSSQYLFLYQFGRNEEDNGAELQDGAVPSYCRLVKKSLGKHSLLRGGGGGATIWRVCVGDAKFRLVGDRCWAQMQA